MKLDKPSYSAMRHALFTENDTQLFNAMPTTAAAKMYYPVDNRVVTGRSNMPPTVDKQGGFTTRQFWTTLLDGHVPSTSHHQLSQE